MATKNNETSHVLHLLEGEGLVPETPEKEEDPIDTPESRIDTEETAVQRQTTDQPGAEQDIPNISIISTRSSEDDPVADLIKEQLEEDFPEDILKPQHADDHHIPDLPEDPDPPTQDHEGAADASSDTESDVGIFPEKIEMETETDGTSASEAPSAEDTVGGPGAPQADPDPALHPFDSDQLENYRFVNVMEYIVKDLVMDYMIKFDMCTCERCRIDTMALALTYCPAKYIVVDSHSVSPLLNFYSNRYRGNVTVELTKACIKIKDNPRH